VEGLASLHRWMTAMAARPACQKGIEVPFKLPDLEAAESDQQRDFIKGAQTLLQK
jgi:hypothetical protein